MRIIRSATLPFLRTDDSFINHHGRQPRTPRLGNQTPHESEPPPVPAPTRSPHRPLPLGAQLHRPSRRAVVATGAWAVPVVLLSVPAPAFAASPACTAPYKITWGTSAMTARTQVGNVQSTVATATVTSGSGTPVTATFSSTPAGTDARDATNLTVPNVTNIGGLGAGKKGIAFSHSNITSGRTNRQTVTIIFSREVSGLSFTVTDIDSDNNNGNNNDYWDQIELSGTRSAVKPATVLGTGVLGDAWHYTNNNTSLAETSSAGIVTVTYGAPVTSITVDYWSATNGGDQWVFLSDFTFTAACS